MCSQASPNKTNKTRKRCFNCPRILPQIRKLTLVEAIWSSLSRSSTQLFPTLTNLTRLTKQMKSSRNWDSILRGLSTIPPLWRTLSMVKNSTKKSKIRSRRNVSKSCKKKDSKWQKMAWSLLWTLSWATKPTSIFKCKLMTCQFWKKTMNIRNWWPKSQGHRIEVSRSMGRGARSSYPRQTERQ